jgi:hypothetical protein
MIGSILFSGSIFLFVFLKKKPVVSEKKNDKKKVDDRVLFDLLFKSNETVVNRNIAPELYQYETWENMNEESDEETVWKKRVLLQNTPNGNIVMFYDLYRQAFGYYSDGHINYNALNHCAMKYVRLYYCRDFFVDTMFLPVSFENPFNKMKAEEETRQKVKASNKRKELNINFDNSAFLKPKVKNKEEQSCVKIIYKNNFRFIGKLSGDWNMLQKQQPIIVSSYVVDYDNVEPTPKSAKNSYSLWKKLTTS